MMKIALLCGGPSLERGISLNSARSVLDHLGGEGVEIVPIYFDHKKRAYKISTAQLYSNTPSDFDFKLRETAKPLSQKALIAHLKDCDIAFPAMHGAFGEDGTIQTFLEKHNIPFIGSSSASCKSLFDKHKVNEFIKEKGFYTLPSTVLKIYANDHKKIVTEFFKKHKLKRAIVKPASGGSSIGVFSVNSVEEALEAVDTLFSKRMDTRVVLEPFAQGIEFTLILLENRFNQGVAILPSEIETDYTENQFFDFRKKYLPTRRVTYHCPPRFSNEIIEKIQIQAEQLFSLLGMHDFARFDGWVMPDGNIWFSDFNPVSGMEQNSFLFQQAARIGFSHRDTLRYIVRNAYRRYGLEWKENKKKKISRKKIAVLFGGNTAERQVSLMSGTNVWLKLRMSELYIPQAYVLGFHNDVWQLPYSLIINHTVDEIIENAKNAKQDMERLVFLTEKACYRLALRPGDISEPFFVPVQYKLQDFIKKQNFVFLGLHGGIGENGTIQKMLEEHKVKYNGSSSKVSNLCMDKYRTAVKINALTIDGVSTARQKIVKVTDLKNAKTLWENLTRELASKTIIVKPRADGCSAGIVRLFGENDLKVYTDLIKSGAHQIKKNTFKNQHQIVDMPAEKIDELLFENFIETDVIKIKESKLDYMYKTGWVEVTVGVYGSKNKLKVMNPSITVAEGEVLSVEEKFQGGTGVNITPPPKSIITPKTLDKIKERIGKIANQVGIEGYARIDAFVQTKTGEVNIIEINNLPGLTPSTVIYHQALAEPKPMFPTNFLEQLIKNKGY